MAPQPATSAAKLRIDKWLWYARAAKTRSLAAKLVTSGSVRLNKDKVTSASQQIKAGDVLTIARAGQIRILKVVALGHRRGPASEAQLLYEDLSPRPDPRGDDNQPPRSEPVSEGRPSKRDRRQILLLKKNAWDD